MVKATEALFQDYIKLTGDTTAQISASKKFNLDKNHQLASRLQSMHSHLDVITQNLESLLTFIDASLRQPLPRKRDGWIRNLVDASVFMRLYYLIPITTTIPDAFTRATKNITDLQSYMAEKVEY
ncbi:hypothetical protein ACHAPU_010201 [Fusarium lateritium]